jgi:hypothetical protein
MSLLESFLLLLDNDARGGQNEGMKLVLCLFAYIFFIGSAQSLDLPKGVPRFAVHWLQVCHMFLDHEGDSMMDLLNADPRAVEQIGDLWRHKAFRDNVEYQKHLKQQYIEQKSLTLEEKTTAISKDLDWMEISYYYDHAEEIEAMIQRRLAKAKVGKK